MEKKAVLVDYAAEMLRKKILGGELKPGQKVGEREMIAELKVSRTPLREAFRVLQAEGLLKHIPQRGVIVAEGLDEQEIIDMMYVQSILLQEASRLAAIHATEEELQELLEIQEEMETMKFEKEEANKKDREFHTLIAKASHNKTLLAHVTDIYDKINHFWYAISFRPERYPFSIKEHKEILSAIIMHEPDQAANCNKIHFAASFVSNRKKIREFNMAFYDKTAENAD